MARADANAKVHRRLGRARRRGSTFLAVDPATRSNTSVCLTIVDPDVAALDADGAGGLRQGASSALLDKEGVAYDIGAYRDAPPGLRIWCGATVETVRPRGADALARLGLRDRRRPRFARPRPDASRPAPTGALHSPIQSIANQGGRSWPSRSRFRQAVGDRRPDLPGRGVEVDYQPELGKDKDKLLEVIGEYDGLAIRSATKVTEKLIAAATNLKVIGRAGIGVDNVDIPAATAQGHHRDEHALRQFDHHGRARHRA